MNPLSSFVMCSLSSVAGQLMSKEPLGKFRKTFLEIPLLNNNVRYWSSSLQCAAHQGWLHCCLCVPPLPRSMGSMKEDFCRIIFLKEVLYIAALSLTNAVLLMQMCAAEVLLIYWKKIVLARCFCLWNSPQPKPWGENELIIFYFKPRNHQGN